jgi:hypothetical protein
VAPREVVTDTAAVYPAVLDELLPSAWLTSSSTRRMKLSIGGVGQVVLTAVARLPAGTVRAVWVARQR